RDPQARAVGLDVVLRIAAGEGDDARGRLQAALDDLGVEPGDSGVVVDLLAVLGQQVQDAPALVLDADLVQDVQRARVQQADFLVAQDLDLGDHGASNPLDYDVDVA